MLAYGGFVGDKPSSLPANKGNPNKPTDPFRSVYTLDRPLVVDGPRRVVLDTVEFQLPADAKQGSFGKAGDWYILDVILQIDLKPSDSLNVHNYVSVLTDGQAAAQIEFESYTAGTTPAVRWSTLELFKGSASGIVLGRSVTLHFSNYLQTTGVRPGTNALSLQLEQPREAIVQSARLLPGSRIARGSLAPPALKLGATASPGHLHVGETASLRYQISSQGFPARDVSVMVIPSGVGIVPVDMPSRFLGWVAQKERTIRFLALAPGSYQIAVQVLGRTGGAASVKVPLEVLASDRGIS